MASFICAMASEDRSLKIVRSKELYVDLKKWLVFPRIRRHRFGSQISAISKNVIIHYINDCNDRKKHSLNSLVTFLNLALPSPCSSSIRKK
jgi:hypothetical protein